MRRAGVFFGSSNGLAGAPVWLALAGVAVAWYFYLRRPELPGAVAGRAGAIHKLLVNKYYFDDLNERVLAPLARLGGRTLWRVGDELIIDGAVVNGSARAVGWLSGVVRRLQTGYLYHYAFAMFIGLAVMLGWLLFFVAGGPA